MTTENGLISGTFVTGTLSPMRIENLAPAQYRLAKKNGVLILQGAYHWSEGFTKNGFEWRDIPTVDL